MGMIKGTIKWERATIGGLPFYVVRDAESRLAVLHFRRDDSIEDFLSELVGCWNYDRAKRGRGEVVT